MFAAYVEWLFFGIIASGSTKPKHELTKIDVLEEHRFLAHLYVLGEKMLDDRFCDSVTRAIVELCNIKTKAGVCYPCSVAIATIYQGTPASSPVRRLLVDLFLQRGNKTLVTSNENGDWNGCVDFLLEVVKGQLPESRKALSPIGAEPKWLKLK